MATSTTLQQPRSTADGRSAELTSIDDVIARYQMPGPHLTAIVRCPAPGAGPAAAETRWHAHAVQLRHRHGPEDVIARMETVYRSLPPTGDTVLITANHTSAATRVLRDDADRDRDAASVGRLPRLLPVVAELQRSQPVLGVLADRVGADIHVIEAGGIRHHETVVGEEEYVHRGAPGGWSQHRFQLRAEQVWKRNAGLVARRLAKLLTTNGVRHAVVSGDVRALGFMLEQLPANVRDNVESVEAGGRHEPESKERLAAAGRDMARRTASTKRNAALGELDNPRAVVAHGIGQAIEPLMRGTVKTVFMVDRVPPHDWLDFAVQRAFEMNAEVVIVPPEDRERLAGDLACVLRPGPPPTVAV